MGNKTLVYKVKVEKNLSESYIHLKRLNNALDELDKLYSFPLDNDAYNNILDNRQLLAFCDQAIYRFSKLQDSIGAKLFKALLLYMGENIDKPFLDILNQLEKIDIVDVEEWFELRDLRNEIAHDYENDGNIAIDIINNIFKQKNELENILNKIKSLVDENR